MASEEGMDKEELGVAIDSWERDTDAVMGVLDDDGCCPEPKVRSMMFIVDLEELAIVMGGCPLAC